jgi:hypothetical protein
MMRKLLMILTVTVAAVGLCIYPAAASWTDSFIQPHTAGSIKYVTGGVGLEERAALAKTENNYNLRLIFATKSGDYLANVSTDISGPDGKVLLDTVVNGPWLFVNLPEGHYKVAVALENQKKVKDISIDKKPELIMFHLNQ